MTNIIKFPEKKKEQTQEEENYSLSCVECYSNSWELMPRGFLWCNNCGNIDFIANIYDTVLCDDD